MTIRLRQDREKIEADIEYFIKSGIYDQKFHQKYENQIDEFCRNAIQIHGEYPSQVNRWSADMKLKLSSFAYKFEQPSS